MNDLQFSYVELGVSKIMALVYFAEGRDLDDIARRLPNGKTGQLGVAAHTIQNWRWEDAMFRYGWEQIERDPLWATRHIIAPQLIISSGARDMEALFGVADPDGIVDEKTKKRSDTRNRKFSAKKL